MARQQVKLLLIVPPDRLKIVEPFFADRDGPCTLRCCTALADAPLRPGAMPDVVLADAALLAAEPALPEPALTGRATWIGLFDEPTPPDLFARVGEALDAVADYDKLSADLLWRTIAMAVRGRSLRRTTAPAGPRDALLRLQSDILQNLSDWVTATDVDGRILYVSPSVEALLGCRPSEVIGLPLEVAFPRSRAGAAPHVESCLQSESHLAGEVGFVARDGREVIVSLQTTAITDAQGRLSGLIHVAHDISDRKRAEDALAEAHARLRRKNARLAELTDTAHRFVDNVAHEFRTPLTVIQEFVSIVTDGMAGPVCDQQAEYLQIVARAAADLGGMVDDLLDTSRIKAGTLRVDRRVVQPESLLLPIQALLRTRAADKGIRVLIEPLGELPAVLADAEKAGRVLVNLVVNAVKFSPESSTVQITGRPVEPAADRL